MTKDDEKFLPYKYNKLQEDFPSVEDDDESVESGGVGSILYCGGSLSLWDCFNCAYEKTTFVIDHLEVGTCR